jgi:site-specific DNA-methyltransferase (adenine-specific)
VFAPIPVVQVGMNVRLAGDGPSNWTCWLVVARPRTGPCVKWGTLRGAYVGNPFDAGENSATASRRSLVVGGKPLWLMERITEDYSRPGALVVDPCCGAGTTLVAAQRTGRRAIGGDAMREHAEIAAKRISRPVQAPLWVPESNEVSCATQSDLFAEEGEG